MSSLDCNTDLTALRSLVTTWAGPNLTTFPFPSFLSAESSTNARSCATAIRQIAHQSVSGARIDGVGKPDRGWEYFRCDIRPSVRATRRSRKRSRRERRVGAGRRLDVQVDTVDMVDKSSFGTEMEGTKSMARAWACTSSV